MFILSSLEDSVRVEPKDLSRPRLVAITSVIEQLMVDKVVADLGLVVTLYDVLSVESGYVHPSDGGARFLVRFRVVVFRPFPGEVIVARAKRASKEGVHASLGFFDDILIPEHYLPEPSFFNESESSWFWRYTDGEGSSNDMDIEFDKEIRFRVQSIKFHTAPTPDELRRLRERDPLIGTTDKPFSPMIVIGQINEEGLGPLSWWKDDESDSDESSDSGKESGSDDDDEEEEAAEAKND
ncbi:hypothetical protein BSKO_06249 [Bryopsis sp. KO-2023]|nr:hypothetical protein BSKO_06249 [Bryopsis sp. KO-2023]